MSREEQIKLNIRKRSRYKTVSVFNPKECPFCKSEKIVKAGRISSLI